MRALLTFLALLTMLLTGSPALAVPPPAPWLAKIDPVLRAAGPEDEVEFILYLARQADLSQAERLATKEAKGNYVWQELTAVAAETQPALWRQLHEMGVAYQSYWIANMIWVQGNGALLNRLAADAAVAGVYANPTVSLQLPPTLDSTAVPDASLTVQPNIALTNAPWAWAQGFSGQGVVVGGQDTGYRWDHVALINQYRGWDGVTADHNYNWHDAIHAGGGSCGSNSPFPCDDWGNGHGTHTMGIMVAPLMGMAPDAQWIGCRNMNVGDGTPITYSECFQWFIAPTDLNGQNPDPARAPHVINNSWSCPPSEGCDATQIGLLEQVVNNVRAAGIVVVASAGNSGPACETIVNPPAIYPATFTVGATDNSDQIAPFSSRGPVSYGPALRIKPDLVAPGVSIYSTLRTGAYGTMSGTSMASPHAAGLVALIISANPDLAGQVDEIEALMRGTTVQLASSQQCGPPDMSRSPNFVYGYGRLDAQRAIQAHLGYQNHHYLPLAVAP